MQSRDPDVRRVYRNPKSCLINELWLLWTFCKHFYQFWLQEIFSNVYFISLHPPGELSMLLFSANYNNTSASSVAICHNSLLWSVENRLQNIKFHRIETFFLDQRYKMHKKTLIYRKRVLALVHISRLDQPQHSTHVAACHVVKLQQREPEKCMFGFWKANKK